MWKRTHTCTQGACVLSPQESGGRCQVRLWSISGSSHELPSPPILPPPPHPSPPGFTIIFLLPHPPCLPPSPLATSTPLLASLSPLSYSFLSLSSHPPPDLFIVLLFRHLFFCVCVYNSLLFPFFLFLSSFRSLCLPCLPLIFSASFALRSVCNNKLRTNSMYISLFSPPDNSIHFSQALHSEWWMHWLCN